MHTSLLTVAYGTALALVGAAATPALAADSGATGYVFAAPPRESAQAAAEIYAPVADYLSKVTGKAVTFHQAGNWIAYQTEMRKGQYDIVFDGPHFNGWRAGNLQHNILVKAPGEHSFVVAVRKDNDRIQELKQLGGRTLCGMSPPNLGTLTVLNRFDNPLRQPVVQNTEGWRNIYQAMIAGRCAAAILPSQNLAKYDPQGTNARVVFRTAAVPSQAFSAGPRVTPEDQGKIARALTAPEARAALARLNESYALSGDFLPAARHEYAAASGILKDTWGY